MGLNEVQAVVDGVSSLDRLSGEDLNGLATVIVKTLGYYDSIGVRSFNIAIYSGSLGDSEITLA
jgi:hypothetical protein